MIVLTVAGSDSSGGAGIQADLKAIAACGAYGASVITAVTAQNTRGVRSAFTLPGEVIRDQLDAVFDDLAVAAVKTGMLADAPTIRVVAEGLRRHAPRHVVCDPVMISKTGFPLLAPEAQEALAQELLPFATVVTPNVHEAEALCGFPVTSLREAEAAGRAILERGARAVVVKGGHLPERPGADLLVTEEGVEVFETTFVRTRHTHGTGCTFSAALASYLGFGATLSEAVRLAKAFITRAVAAGFAVGRGVGPTDPFFFLRGRPPERPGWLAFCPDVPGLERAAAQDAPPGPGGKPEAAS